MELNWGQQKVLSDFMNQQCSTIENLRYCDDLKRVRINKLQAFVDLLMKRCQEYERQLDLEITQIPEEQFKDWSVQNLTVEELMLIMQRKSKSVNLGDNNG